MSAVTPLSKEQVTPRFRRLDWLHWPLLMVVLLQGFYLWFNPYIYQSWQNGHLVRISRFTGEAERLTIYGWRTLEKRDDRARTLKPPLDLRSVSRYFPPAVDKTSRCHIFAAITTTDRQSSSSWLTT